MRGIEAFGRPIHPGEVAAGMGSGRRVPDGKGLKEIIRKRCREMEIPLAGFAGAGRWDIPLFEPWVPEAYRPRSIFPETCSVIVIGLPIHLPVLETAPSLWYREEYRTVNTLLDQYTYRLAAFLNREGYPSVPVPRDGYGSIKVLLRHPVAFFSHRHAAVLAGLGNFGTSNTVLTPEFGPRVRFGTVFTAAVLPEDPLLETPLCTRCMRCVERCPAGALAGGDYPTELTDTHACAARSADLNTRYLAPCGICIRVCPVGEDRKHFGREDPALYDPGKTPAPLERAWKHVQDHGGL
jgi:epoxyqueuosine reductase QueG